MKKQQIIRKFLSGEILISTRFREQYIFIALFVVLVLTYMYGGYMGQRQQVRYAEVQKQLEDATYEQLTIHATLMQYSKQSAVSHRLRTQGSKVTQNTTPVIRITP